MEDIYSMDDVYTMEEEQDDDNHESGGMGIGDAIGIGLFLSIWSTSAMCSLDMHFRSNSVC